MHYLFFCVFHFCVTHGESIKNYPLVAQNIINFTVNDEF